ncbi:MYXO-CTERM sorting domain-containing protein [Nannocystis bainbridge]|uniref:MYXO-CTERM sorting domain-containing protein n=1 Tax=Nannocystis bainbridge TaxID=2995303 RepID=A0ABT5DR07_9BACT|nr:MYXO-CTERM sorting domain-containing protein [Nannocystis bainbridge]MDC0716084.1 MYXO-CTERM sorting domain-containing protein [Nannocystis bainbridge]
MSFFACSLERAVLVAAVLSPTFAAAAVPIGEPVGMLTNHDERVLGFMTNRIRRDPAAADALPSMDGKTPSGRPIPPASPPLELVADLARAANFQATHIATTECPLCADHSTCCVLAGMDADTHCDGPVTVCGVTSMGERFSHFSDRAHAENGSEGGASAELIMLAWIESDAHWGSINGASSTALGTGSAQGFGKPVRHLVFGTGGTYPVAGDGVHFRDIIHEGGPGPKMQPMETPTFGITYALPGGGPPEVAQVVHYTDGVTPVCEPLALRYGQPDLGTYETVLSPGPGCHRYFFHIVDGQGVEHLYPTTGTLGFPLLPLGADPATCPDFEPMRAEAPCAGTVPQDTTGSDTTGSDDSGDDSGDPSGDTSASSDASATNPTGDPTSEGPTSAATGDEPTTGASTGAATSASTTDPATAGEPASGDSDAGCGCRTDDRAPGQGIAFTSLLVLTGWLLRRRRA